MSDNNDPTDAQSAAVQDLINYISSLSEEAYCASWMHGVEFALWRRVSEGPGRYGRLDITNEHIQKLRGVARKCGGWVFWHPTTCETFVPLREWMDMYDKWCQSRPRPDGDF